MLDFVVNGSVCQVMNVENELGPMKPNPTGVDIAELFAFLTMALEDAAGFAAEGQADGHVVGTLTQLLENIRPLLFRSANLADEIAAVLGAPDVPS